MSREFMLDEPDVRGGSRLKSRQFCCPFGGKMNVPDAAFTVSALAQMPTRPPIIVLSVQKDGVEK